MTGKPTREQIRATARAVDAYFAHREARKVELATAIAIVRNIKSIPRKCDVLPDLVKRR